MARIILICSLAWLALFSACTPKALDIDLPQEQPKLVISSQIIPDQVMLVTVTKSFGALEYQQDGEGNEEEGEEDEENENDTISSELVNQLVVNNAEVTISYQGITDTLEPLGNGLYTSLNTPQFVNVEYTLRVYDPGLDQTVTSGARMLEFVNFNNATAQRDSSNNLHYVDVDFSINDPAGSNWYMVNFYSNNNSDGNISPFSLETGRTELLLLSDAEFENGVIEDSHRLYDWESDTVYVSMSNISREYHDYLSLRIKSNNSLGSFLNEPVGYPSNVVGGLGYFTTHYPDIRVFEVPE